MEDETNSSIAALAMMSVFAFFACSAAAVAVIVAEKDISSGFFLLGIALIPFLILVILAALSSFGSRKSYPVVTKDTSETEIYHRGYYDGTQGLAESVNKEDSKYFVYKQAYMDGEKGRPCRLAYTD